MRFMRKSDSGNGVFVGRIRDENSVQELKLREVESRIESEMAGLRTLIETAKVTSMVWKFDTPKC